jgi:lantibiotic modifying enzyme
MSIDAAVRIGRTLVERALWHEDRCNWIDAARPLPPDYSAYGSRPLGPDLYGGTAGIAWFLGYLYASTHDDRFRTFALGAIRHSLAGAHRLHRAERLSFYSGAVGVAFAAIELATLLDERVIECDAGKILREIIDENDRGSRLDLVTGLAGAIAALPILSVRLADKGLLDVSMRFADRILDRAKASADGLSWRSGRKSRHRNLIGFAHGAAGIGYGLLEMFSATGYDRYRRAAEAAFNYEQSWFNSELQNWPDFREVSSRARSTMPIPFLRQWCHGAPGIALSRLRAWELLRDERYRTEAVTALRTTRAALVWSLETERGDLSLCHGLAGLAEILNEGSIILERDEREKATDLAAAGAKESERRARRWHSDSPTLFLGLAGVGYLNLRLSGSRAPTLLMLRRERFV